MDILVSSRWRIVIPKQIRERLQIKAGDKLKIEEDDGIILITQEKF